MPLGWTVLLGTRPELVKLAPVVRALQAAEVPVTTWASGQHDFLLHRTADSAGAGTFVASLLYCGLVPHPDPGVFAGRVAAWVRSHLTTNLIVQGDTATAYGGAMGARDAGFRVAHVEAGVRTGDDAQPWPEERFRVAIDRVARWRFAPTEHCLANLEAEGLDGVVTGNTGIDDLRDSGILHVQSADPLVLITLHRRESHAVLPEIAALLGEIARRRPHLRFLWPMHPNPQVQLARGSAQDLEVVPPMGALEFRRTLARAQLVVTDSGGVQEEAADLGVPCVVARNVTDRPEAVEAGIARLGGTDPHRLAIAVRDELEEPTMRREPHAIYGDGKAGERIAQYLAQETFATL